MNESPPVLTLGNFEFSLSMQSGIWYLGVSPSRVLLYLDKLSIPDFRIPSQQLPPSGRPFRGIIDIGRWSPATFACQCSMCLRIAFIDSPTHLRDLAHISFFTSHPLPFAFRLAIFSFLSVGRSYLRYYFDER
jgi:hypothetical protein